MQLNNPYDIFTEKQKRSLRFKLTNLIIVIQCWFINRSTIFVIKRKDNK